MKFKTYEGMSLYIISDEGRLYEKPKPGKPLQLVPMVKGLIKATTDERFLITDKDTGKLKSSKLVRRFSIEDIKKMYAHPKAVAFTEVESFVDKTIIPGVDVHVETSNRREEDGTIVSTTSFSTEVPIVINTGGRGAGKTFMAEQAGIKFTKPEPKPKRAKLKDETGHLTVDQIASSKRTVKSHPKAAKATKKIKEAMAGVEVAGVPYMNANQAAKAIGVSINTVINRINKGVNGYKRVE